MRVSSSPPWFDATNIYEAQLGVSPTRIRNRHTCKVFTVWNLTKRRGMCLASLRISSDNWITCATAGSTCDSTSSNPTAGLFVTNLMVLGPWEGSAVCITMDRTRTFWLNWGKNKLNTQSHVNLVLTVRFISSCSSASLSKYAGVVLRTLEPIIPLMGCLDDSLRQFVCETSRNSSKDI